MVALLGAQVSLDELISYSKLQSLLSLIVSQVNNHDVAIQELRECGNTFASDVGKHTEEMRSHEVRTHAGLTELRARVSGLSENSFEQRLVELENQVKSFSRNDECVEERVSMLENRIQVLSHTHRLNPDKELIEQGAAKQENQVDNAIHKKNLDVIKKNSQQQLPKLENESGIITESERLDERADEPESGAVTDCKSCASNSDNVGTIGLGDKLPVSMSMERIEPASSLRPVTSLVSGSFDVADDTDSSRYDDSFESEEEPPRRQEPRHQEKVPDAPPTYKDVSDLQCEVDAPQSAALDGISATFAATPTAPAVAAVATVATAVAAAATMATPSITRLEPKIDADPVTIDMNTSISDSDEDSLPLPDFVTIKPEKGIGQQPRASAATASSLERRPVVSDVMTLSFKPPCRGIDGAVNLNPIGTGPILACGNASPRSVASSSSGSSFVSDLASASVSYENQSP